MTQIEQNNYRKVIKIAYAEDHTAVRKSIIAYLHELGGVKVIIEAENGKVLIDKMEQSPKQPGVCIIDINMPVMNGFETLAAIRERWKNCKVLVLSTYSDEMYVLRMLTAGANGYLNKACNPEEIRHAVMTIHEKGNYYTGVYLEKTLERIQNNKILKLSNFTETEITFLKYCCKELTYSQIAQQMNCTTKSVEGYRDSLFRKLQVNSRVSLALFAARVGLVLL